MAEAGYKSLISYKLTRIAFDLGWDFVPKYYNRIEDSRQRDQIKQALRSHKQNIVEGKDGIEAVVNYLIDLLTRSGYLLDRQINAVEEKHQREGGYNENLLKKRLEYKRSY